MRPLTSNKWLKFENIGNTKCWRACGATEILLHCQWKIQNGTATLENKLVISYRDFPDSSVGKESTCNSGDPGLIPGSGRSAREGIGYPLQYSWASLVAQLVKNLPAMQETRDWSLGWEDPLEKGKATHSRILEARHPTSYSCTPSQILLLSLFEQNAIRHIFLWPREFYQFESLGEKCYTVDTSNYLPKIIGVDLRTEEGYRLP